MNDKMYIPKVFDNIDKERTITAIDCDGNKTEITFMCKALGGFRHDGTRYLLDGHYFLPDTPYFFICNMSGLSITAVG